MAIPWKESVTADEFGKMPDALKAFYEVDSNDSARYVSAVDGLQSLRQAKENADRNAKTRGDLLAKLVPGIKKEDGKGFIEFSAWPAIVDPVAEAVAALYESSGSQTINGEVVKSLLGGKGGSKKDGTGAADDSAAKLTQLAAEKAKLLSDLTIANANLAKATEKDGRVTTRLNSLIRDREFDAAADSLNIVDPVNRQMARAVWAALNPVVQEVEDNGTSKEVVFVKDNQGVDRVLGEYLKTTWAPTEVGKALMTAKTGNGSGSGGVQGSGAARGAVDMDKMTPMQLLDLGMSQSSGFGQSGQS
jgi:hypothetical protein